VENLQRSDLDPLEEAEAFRRLMSERGYTVRSLGERLGKTRGYITNRLAVLNYPTVVQEMVAQRPDTLVSAQEVARIPDSATQRELARRVVTENLPYAADLSLRKDKTDAEPLDGKVLEQIEQMQAIVRTWMQTSTSFNAATQAHLWEAAEQLRGELKVLENQLKGVHPT